jgi:hypothetical protein
MISPQIEGDSLILASGFFQEDPTKDYSVLDDRLLNVICSNEKITNIQVIGAMRSPAPFLQFCDKLEQNWHGGIPERHRTSNWHAKIAMKLKTPTNSTEKIPVCTIIGSSNLTRPAYGVDNDVPPTVTSKIKFNYECDVLIFSNDAFANKNLKAAPKKVFPGFRDQDNWSIYYPDMPEGAPNETDQMKVLLKEIEDHIRK